MRLGLIGTGKQGQRYLMEKNGGRHIARSGSRDLDDWEGLDGVIIATHPAGHLGLAMECIERRIPFLCEKPLALTERDCLAIIDTAETRGVPMNVAHLDLWAWRGLANYLDPGACCVIRYAPIERDYSPWLDWAPHALALLDKVGACFSENVSLSVGAPSVVLHSSRGGVHYRRDLMPPNSEPTPMFLATRDIKKNPNWDSLRRIYRALFSEEHG